MDLLGVGDFPLSCLFRSSVFFFIKTKMCLEGHQFRKLLLLFCPIAVLAKYLCWTNFVGHNYWWVGNPGNYGGWVNLFRGCFSLSSFAVLGASVDTSFASLSHEAVQWPVQVRADPGRNIVHSYMLFSPEFSSDHIWSVLKQASAISSHGYSMAERALYGGWCVTFCR